MEFRNIYFTTAVCGLAVLGYFTFNHAYDLNFGTHPSTWTKAYFVAQGLSIRPEFCANPLIANESWFNIPVYNMFYNTYGNEAIKHSPFNISGINTFTVLDKYVWDGIYEYFATDSENYMSENEKFYRISFALKNELPRAKWDYTVLAQLAITGPGLPTYIGCGAWLLLVLLCITMVYMNPKIISKSWMVCCTSFLMISLVFLCMMMVQKWVIACTICAWLFVCVFTVAAVKMHETWTIRISVIITVLLGCCYSFTGRIGVLQFVALTISMVCGIISAVLIFRSKNVKDDKKFDEEIITLESDEIESLMMKK